MIDINEPKTFYHQEVLRIQKSFFPKDDLVKQLNKAKKYIELNYSKNINLDDIAEHVFFSKFHFIRLFKKVYGRTPYQYLISVRTAKAKELLKNNLDISEVCFLVGFESVTSFTHLFKKNTGFTPSDYQKIK